MKTTIKINEGFEVEITPEILAKAFWAMDNAQQADFFDALAGITEEDYKTNQWSYSFGELQWCHLKEELRQPGRERANKMHMALSAFAFDFWPMKFDGAREGL